MQNRQQIREQFGILEEQLEELGSLACAHESGSAVGTDLLLQDALESVRELSRLVHEQQLLKSVPAHDFLVRVSGLLIQDATTQGVDLAIAHFGEGRISMEMAELIMGGIVAGYRASLRSLKAATRQVRVQNNLFPTGSIYLEVRSVSSEIQFRILDDGRGFGNEAASERSFQKLREHIARCGGWFSRSGFRSYGGVIEFKVPLSHNRAEALVLRDGAFEVLVPSVCVAEVTHGSRVQAGAFRLHETDGLVDGGEACPVHVRVGVADLQFWIGCESVTGPVRARRMPADAYVEEGCWLRSFGLFLQDGNGRALPMLDGPAMIRFRKGSGGEA